MWKHHKKMRKEIQMETPQKNEKRNTKGSNIVGG
jgi:hypothetical protein